MKDAKIPPLWKPGSLPDRIHDMLRDDPGDIHDVQATLHVLVAYWAAVDKGELDRSQVNLHIERLESAWNDHAFGVHETNGPESFEAPPADETPDPPPAGETAN